jgi:uncharacterized protein (TIGR03067 family)
MRLLARALIATILFAAGSGPTALAQTAGKLDGTWTVLSAESNGKPDDAAKGRRLTVAGDTFSIQAPDGKMLFKGTVKTDRTKTPARIDFRHTEGEAKGKTWLGIYQVEGDDLKIADNFPDPAKPRPTHFAAAPGSGHIVLAFKRAPR